MAKAVETQIKVSQVVRKYTVNEVNAMTKVDLKDFVANGMLANSDADVLMAALTRLATKSEKQEKAPIVAVRTFTKDCKKGTAGTTVDLNAKNVRNILMVQAQRVHKDVVLQEAQVDLWVADIMADRPFIASYYTISKK